MSQVAVDFQTQTSSAILAKAGRQNSASQKASSSRFDDLLSAIPDAPQEPQARAKTDAPERPQPAETRSPKRDERADRTSRDDRTAQADRTAKSDTAADDGKAPAADAAPTKDAGTTGTDTAATETKSADGAATDETKSSDTDSKATDGENTDTTAVTQAAVEAMVPQAVVIDPTAAPVGEPALDGEVAAKTATKVETATGATQPSNKAAEQQAAMLADQSTGLSADDAEVLSALAAKAQQGLKNAEGDKAEKKASSDKPAHTAKQGGGDAATAQMAQADGTEAKSTEPKSAEARPVQSDLAKVGVEHQRSQGDNDAKPADHAAQGITVNSVAPKTDGMQLQNFSAVLHQTHATGASASASGAASISSDDKAVSIANVPVEISAKITSGKNQFDIRLDPEELGKIHVKVNVDRDGNITTHMVADRPETLDLLRRDTQGLERALQDAGLKTSDNSLQFSLRDQTQQQQQNQQDGQATRQSAAEDELATTLTTTVIARDYGRYSSRPSGVDIRV
ncbi:flagellar hook-length control protein FliK [Pseudolabrys sp. FHR47]|uniref:flagellar hook-length control protein FliK n=1 Tax=Pseudolabrys sp. FHR47 TaxID=2562284 RepID=UPI0010BF643A|nr:flagellar hook-length control protein FliK [Pseudolabrys sp. FHR47]